MDFTTTLQGTWQQEVGNGARTEDESLHLETQLGEREVDREKEREKTEGGKDGGRDGWKGEERTHWE